MKKINWLIACLFSLAGNVTAFAQRDTSDMALIHAIVGSKFFLVPTERKIEKLDSFKMQIPDTGMGRVGEQYDALRGEIVMSYLKAGDKASAAKWQKKIRTQEGMIKSTISASVYLLNQDEKSNVKEVEAGLRPLVDEAGKAFRKDGSSKDKYNRLMPVYVRSLLILGKQDQVLYHLEPLYIANGKKFPSDMQIRVMMKPGDYKIIYNLSYDYGMALAAAGRSKEAIAVLARLYLTGEEVSEQIQADIKAASNKIPGGDVYFQYLTDSVRNYYKQKISSFAAAKKDLNGKAVDINALKSRYVLLDFWGSWCRPCRASHPHLKELYSKFKDKGFEIIGIASEHAKTADERHKLWSTAIAEDGLTWLQVLNNDNVEQFNAVKEYGVTAFPTKI
ncbi:MAG TPA: TlpA disulfide reductase family protein, partial [Niastella sp.]|nr:TlpA disulfide reductase family protein [Niastella sp.]